MKISVLVVTYNHERFIAQAIESALMQQVNFNYEIVIGEDCSPDSTRNIVIDYQKRYPDKIRLLLHEKNLGGHRNFVQTLQACQGQYIAYLEGDDYWTSPHKLQKQAEFLDNHPESAIGFHNAKVFSENKNWEDWNYCPINQKSILTIEDLFVSNFIPSSSVIYRRDLVGEIPDWFDKIGMGDWPFHILNAQYGEIGYINEVMSAYRIHSGGVWSRKNPVEQLQAVIKMLDRISVHIDSKYEQIIKKSSSRYSAQLAGLYQANSDRIRNYLEDTLRKDLRLRDKNIVIFPDWSQPEDSLYQDLASAIGAIITHPDKNRMTLLIDTSNVDEEEANLALSSVVMNLMMEEDLDVSEDVEISLVGNLSEMEWQVLLPRIHARLILNFDNKEAIMKVGAEHLPILEM